MTPILDRLVPTDWKHVDKYPLQATTMPEGPRPVIAGTNWYREFSRPTYDASDRRWWVARDGRLTYIDGGHCYLLKDDAHSDPIAWWRFYDQGQEGACVGFGCARAMSHVDRKRFAARDIYRAAQRIDEWVGDADGETGPRYEGTSVRAGVDVLRTVGAAVVRAGRTGEPKPEHGVAANRWATSMADVYGCLGSPRLERQGVVAFLNSWGELGPRRGYPHITYMPAEVFERLLREDGEATVFTAR